MSADRTALLRLDSLTPRIVASRGPSLSVLDELCLRGILISRVGLRASAPEDIRLGMVGLVGGSGDFGVVGDRGVRGRSGEPVGARSTMAK